MCSRDDDPSKHDQLPDVPHGLTDADMRDLERNTHNTDRRKNIGPMIDHRHRPGLPLVLAEVRAQLDKGARA